MGHSNTDRVCEQVSFYRFVSKNMAATTEAWKKSYTKVHRGKHGILVEKHRSSAATADQFVSLKIYFFNSNVKLNIIVHFFTTFRSSVINIS